MQSSIEIKKHFAEKEYREIYTSCPVDSVAEALGFVDGLRLSYRLLYNKSWEEELQQYAINLILSVKSKFPNEWEKDWRNEAFLGNAYNVLLGDDRNYNERHKAYLRAYKKSDPVPPELLIALASCFDAPGEPPVSYDQAIKWLKKSLEIEPYSAAVGLLSSIYWCKNDENELAFWQKTLKELQASGKRAPPLEPAFVREGYE